MKKRPILATYYFPNWHSDPRIESLHGKGWTEWQVTKHATPRFEGHQQPKVPLWGYLDESKPEVMSLKITTAKAYGIDAFIFDWYCFNDGPYRERCLDEGFLKAVNCQDIKFALMWCNHNAVYAHPGSYCQPQKINWRGDDITPETFIRETDIYIEKYFSKPNYLRVDGGLYFSFWQPQKLIESLGGDQKAKELIMQFRQKVAKAGLGELNLNAHCDCWERDQETLSKYSERLKECGFNTISDYNWGHFGDAFPTIDYGEWMNNSLPLMRNKCEFLTLPYSPSVCSGWDSSPRTVQSDMYEPRGYPFSTIVVNNIPEYYQYALSYAKELYDKGISKSEMIQLPCWNEWTEGTYLEPDTQYGYGFLQTIKNVFG